MFGSAILDMLGVQDPRRQVLQQALGGGGTAPAAPGTPGAPTPGTPAQPQAYTTPPQLLELYDSLMSRSTRERRIDSGIGLIASSFAQPENRSSIMQAASGGGYESPSDVFSLITGLQEQQQAAMKAEQDAAERARQEQALPAIAAQYGLSEEVARNLFDNGQLDDLLVKLNEPNTEVQAMPDGSLAVIDKTSAKVKSVVAPSVGVTNDDKLYNQYVIDQEKRGLPVLSLDDWLSADANRKRQQTKIDINTGQNQADLELMKALDAKGIEQFNAASDGVKTIETVQEARRQINSDAGVIVGDLSAPARLEGRKMLATLFGFKDEAATNTDVMNSELKRIVLPLVKQLGTGNSISNADREYVEKMVGTGTLTEEALRRILDITERGQRREIVKANERMRARVDQAGEDSPLKKAFVEINVPYLSQEYIDSVTARVPESDRNILVQNMNDPLAIAEFDQQYGEGSARDIIEALTGIDVGPPKVKRASDNRPDGSK